MFNKEGLVTILLQHRDSVLTAIAHSLESKKNTVLNTMAAVLLNFTKLLSQKQERKYRQAKHKTALIAFQLLKTLDSVQLSASQTDQTIIDSIFYCFIIIGTFIYYDEELNAHLMEEGLDTIAKGFFSHSDDKLRDVSKEFLLLMQLKKND